MRLALRNVLFTLIVPGAGAVYAPWLILTRSGGSPRPVAWPAVMLIIGGILGWVASLIMGTDAQQGIFLNIVVGVIGALLAGFLLTPLFGVGTINQNNFSLSALLVSLLGAIVLLAIVNLFRRGTVR